MALLFSAATKVSNGFPLAKARNWDVPWALKREFTSEIAFFVIIAVI